MKMFYSLIIMNETVGILRAVDLIFAQSFVT